MNNEPIITKAPHYPVQRIEYNELTQLYRVKPEPFPISVEVKKLSFWDKIRLLPTLFIIAKGLAMGDLKTTISGVVKVVFQLATIFGLGFGKIDEAMVTGVLWGIVSIYQSYQTSDKKH